MNRIPLRRFDALMSLRPIIMNRHVLPTCTRRRLSDSPAAATMAAVAAAENQRRWVMLSRFGTRIKESFVADSKSVAEARTSTGQHLRVSLRCAAPPASSKLCYDFPQEQDGGNDNEYLNVEAAAHGDLFLLQMGRRHGPVDHFVYTPAGDARLPSLYLLPVRDFLTKFEGSTVRMVLPPTTETTGLLRRGQNDVLVVQFHLCSDLDAPRDQRRLMAELCVLCPGLQRQWELMEPVPILHDQGVKGDELILKSPKFVISVGDRFLCWVHYSSGFVLCDMADEGSPKACYVPFPDELTCRGDGCSADDDDSSCEDESDADDDDSSCGDESDGNDNHDGRGCDDGDDDSSWDDESDDDDDPIGGRYTHMVAAGNRNVRLVNMNPRGDSGFTIKTWTMNLGADEPLAWVKDGEIASEELWELPGHEGLPRLQQKHLQCTSVCLDLENPDAVGLLVCNDYHSIRNEVWMIQLNIKTKTLLSAVQLFTDDPMP